MNKCKLNINKGANLVNIIPHLIILNKLLFIFRLSSKSKIYVVTDNNMLSQEGELKKINDLIEVDSFILTVGDSNIYYK